MHSESQVQRNSRVFQPHTIRVFRLLTWLIVVCFLSGAPTAARNGLWAQEPDPPEPPSPPPPISATFLSFSAIEHPGLDNWLISGQIGDCSDPSDIGVTIDGAVTASATTDIFGYFEVIVTYSGPVDEITADADYEGVPIPQAFAEIGT